MPVLAVVRTHASPATTLAVASTYVNNVKIIASFNFNVIPGIISCDEHIGSDSYLPNKDCDEILQMGTKIYRYYLITLWNIVHS